MTMKFTLSWLKEHLETDKSLAEITDAMTMAGLEIEGVEDPGEALAAFTVAHVKSAEPHPDADKLRVCTVDTFEGEKLIVCGAPNARAGMKAIYAPLGTYIPGADFALDKKPRKIRGVESHGMLCSAKELNAGDDHDGIIDLQGDFAVGTPAAEALGANDPVIDFEVTPNRPDWLGVDGIARDLAAAGVGTLKTTDAPEIDGKFDCPIMIELDFTEACPVFAGRVIRGVKNGPSPDWLKARLKAIGLRPINRLVDITNLMSHDRCRPLHVYDVSKLTGPIRARRGQGASDRFEALDGKTYEPSAEQCVIADDARCLGFGGVMGGEYSGSSEATTDVFVECAWFDPQITRATGRATGIESDAKHRFERGIDTGFVRGGLDMATALILDLCGGEASHMVVAGEEPARPDAIAFNPYEVKRLTGLDVPHDEMRAILSALGFGVVGTGDDWSVEVPTWRADATFRPPPDRTVRAGRAGRWRSVDIARPSPGPLPKNPAPPCSAAMARGWSWKTRSVQSSM